MFSDPTSLHDQNSAGITSITKVRYDSYESPTFDLIAKLRARRLKWAGQILRLEPEDSLVHQRAPSADGCSYA